MKTKIILIALLFAQIMRADTTIYPIAYYDFEDQTVNDKSGNGNNGTIYGGYNYVTNAVNSNYSIELTGNTYLYDNDPSTSDYDSTTTPPGNGSILLPSFDSSLNNQFTVSLWVDHPSIMNQPNFEDEQFISLGTLDGPQTGIGIDLNNIDDPYLYYYLDTGMGGPDHLDRAEIDIPITNLPLFSDIWENLVMVYSPGELSAYINGQLVGTSFDPSLNFTGFPVSYAGINTHFWDNGMQNSERMTADYDNIAIYNYAFNSDEILTLWNNDGSPGLDPPGVNESSLNFLYLISVFGVILMCGRKMKYV